MIHTMILNLQVKKKKKAGILL